MNTPLLDALILENEKNKDVFKALKIDRNTGEVETIREFDIKIGGGVGVVKGGFTTGKTYVFYLYRFKGAFFHCDQILIENTKFEFFGQEMKKEVVNYTSCPIDAEKAQNILMIAGAKTINRTEFEHLYKVFQKSILMPSLSKKSFETIKLFYNI